MKIGNAVTKFEMKWEMILENWDAQQVAEFRHYWGLDNNIEVMGRNIEQTDILVDYQMPVIRTKDYAKYLVTKLLGKGNTFRQVIKKAGITPKEYSKIKNDYTRNIFIFIDKENYKTTSSTMVGLVNKLREKNICDISVSNAHNKLNNGGVYTYYGTYIGTFSREKYSRRLLMVDANKKPLTKEWWK